MFLLIDIGGTKTRIAVSKDKQTLEDIHIIETPQDFEEAMVAIKTAVSEVTKGENIDTAAIAVPGVLNKEKAQLERSPNLIPWINHPLKQKLLEFIHAPLFIENDAQLGGLGEVWFGAGKGFDIVAFYTISTGVGGARIVNGHIDKYSLGFEPGAQIIGFDEKPITLESRAGGRGLKELYHTKPEDINDPKVWAEVARDLAIGINNALVFWSPDVVILGGSVVQSIDLDLLRKNVKDFCIIFPTIPPIKKAALGDESGLYGALAYLQSKTS